MKNNNNEDEDFIALKVWFEEVQADKVFMAYWLEAFREKFLIKKETLIKRLSIDEKQYYHLGVCKYPLNIPNSTGVTDSFKEQVRVMAEQIGCDELVLENLLSY